MTRTFDARRWRVLSLAAGLAMVALLVVAALPGRGWIVYSQAGTPPAPPDSCFVAPLSGQSEVPPNNSTAAGLATFLLSSDRTTLYYHIAFAGLSSPQTAAHIHQAPPGQNGPIVFPKGVPSFPLGSPISGALTLSAEERANLLAGLFYVNVHSQNFPGGEIRGQIMAGANCSRNYLPFIGKTGNL